MPAQCIARAARIGIAILWNSLHEIATLAAVWFGRKGVTVRQRSSHISSGATFASCRPALSVAPSTEARDDAQPILSFQVA